MRKPPSNKIKLDEVLLVSLFKEKGIMAISKEMNLPQHVIIRRLKTLGEYSSERANKKKEFSNPRKRTKVFEFKDVTKQQAFERENGICQECKKPIECNWRQATYHHTILVIKGGLPTLDNCMVLHHDCHFDPVIFKKLHGFELQYAKYRMPNREPRKLERIPDEKVIPLFNAGFTFKYIAEQIKRDKKIIQKRVYDMVNQGKLSRDIYDKHVAIRYLYREDIINVLEVING